MKIKLNGIIGEDVLASDIIGEIDIAASQGADIELMISSPGGVVSEAVEVADRIRSYEGTTTSHILFAASAASFISCVCDAAIAYPQSVLMIHSASQLVNGPSSAHRRSADMLDGIDSMLAETYSTFTGHDLFKIIGWMEAETWLEGQAIHEMGFATIFDDSEDVPVQPATNAHEQFERMAASYAERAQDIGRVSALQSWIQQHPGNDAVKAVVDQAIKTGQSERMVRAKLMVAARGPALTREDVQAAAAVGMTLDDYRRFMPKAEGV